MFLIMKILSKVKIHLFFYIFMFVCFITGNIRDYIVFTSIIIIHELGHILGGILFKWEISKVILLPFGGLTVFNTNINTSLLEQFIVTLFGPLFQLIFSLFLVRYASDQIIYYNFALLFFNLLPIYPLDGSKFLYVVLGLLFPFKLCHLVLLFVSCLFIGFCFCFFSFNLIIYLILFFLIIKVMEEFRNHRLIFNRFLFERYICDFGFRHVKIVKNCHFMFLGYKHVFLDGKDYVTEKKYLAKRFDKHSNL